MDKLIESGSVTGLLTGLCVMIAMQLVARVGEFLWRVKEKKDSVTETSIQQLSEAMRENTQAMTNLEERIKKAESMLGGVSKVRLDVRRLYSAMRYVAGDKWAKIREDIMDTDEAS